MRLRCVFPPSDEIDSNRECLEPEPPWARCYCMYCERNEDEECNRSRTPYCYDSEKDYLQSIESILLPEVRRHEHILVRMIKWEKFR